jgi:hypothetical protein
MPFIAIVHIPDDHTAESIIGQAHTMEQIYGARVVGLFDFPNRAELKCSGNCVRKGTGAWGRNRRGFMECTICGSRNRKMRHWLMGALFDYLGANLYPNAPAAFRTPEGYGLPRGQ